MIKDDLMTRRFRAKDIQRLLNIDTNKLYYWSKTHQLLTPEVEEASGTGTSRIFSFKNILELATIKQMLNLGFDLNAIKKLKEKLDTFNLKDKKSVNIFSAVLDEYADIETALHIYLQETDFERPTKEQDFVIYLQTYICKQKGAKRDLVYLPNDPQMADNQFFSFRIDIGKIAFHLKEKLGID